MAARRKTRRSSDSHAGAQKSTIAAERRLNARDWLEAGQEVLREQGIAGVKLAALRMRLGVSTGSFYHHFSDFEAYLGALARFYSVERVAGVLHRALNGAADPLARIQRLARLSVQERTFELDRAMRVWATMDQRAAKVMRRSERLVLDFLTDAFRELGFAESEAGLRARILLAVNIAPLGTDDRDTRRAFFKSCLRLLTTPAPS